MCYTGKCHYENYTGDCVAPKDLFMYDTLSDGFINEKKEEARSYALCVIVENAQINQFFMVRYQQIYPESVG